VPSASLLALALVLVEMWRWCLVLLRLAQLVPLPSVQAKVLESTNLVLWRLLPVMPPTLAVLGRLKSAVAVRPLSRVEVSLYQAALLSLELVVLLTSAAAPV
jgi:hypothetical protein